MAATVGIIPSVGTIAAGAVIGVSAIRAGAAAVAAAGENAGDGDAAAIAGRTGAIRAGICQYIVPGAARIDIIETVIAPRATLAMNEHPMDSAGFMDGFKKSSTPSTT